MLDTRRLEVLRSVVSTGSLRRSADELGFTASAVSQQLATLARETGLQLLAREGRGVRVTPAARRLAGASAAALRALAELDTVVADERAGRERTLRVSYFASAGATWIPTAIAAIALEFPKIGLELHLSELGGHVEPDVEIVVEGSESHSDEMRQVRLLTETYVAVLPTDHPLAGETSIRLVQLADDDWIDNDVLRGQCRAIVVDACDRVGLYPHYRIETHDYATAAAMVRIGMGISVMPRLAIRQLPADAVAVDIVDPVLERAIALRWRKSLDYHPAVRRLVALLHIAAEREGER